MQTDFDKELNGRRCIVTGGASFIGSHLVDRLLSSGAAVVVLDDLSSGRIENLPSDHTSLDFLQGDVMDATLLSRVLRPGDTVFHLAAIHGGRGYIDTHPALMLRNLALDWTVFQACRDSGVHRVIHASSACAYPTFLQDDPNDRGLLTEDQAGFDRPGAAFPDGAYGWAKLMGEYQLQTMCADGRMSGRSARIFTAYGSRENESHAVVALVAKALLRMDPMPIWGDGTQTRNFTHVADTVTGLMLLATDSNSNTFDVVNIGTDQHHTILETLEVIFDLIGWRPDEIDRQLHMPVGVKARAASTSRIEERYGWRPQVGLRRGLEELIAWYELERLPGLTPDVLAERLIAR